MNIKFLTVVHTVPTISMKADGVAYAASRLCESLIAASNTIILATLDWEPIDSPPTFLKLFPIYCGPKKLGISPSMHKWLMQTAIKDEIRLIHNHGLWMMPNVYPGWVAKKSGLPLIVSPHGTLSNWAMQNGSLVKRFFWPLIQRPALNATTCFHATAESEYHDIRRMGFKQPVAIIPNGIDISAWQPKKHTEYRTLLFLGRVHPIKGLDMLLPAWAAIQHRFPEWRLKIVGPDNGGYLQEMQKLAMTLRLERVEFVGSLFGQDKWQAYQNADLFVLPTYSENFGMSVAEALAVGTPVIVTRGAPWQGLDHHQAGWWIDISVDALTTTLEYALTLSNNELETMGQRGRQWMETEFSWQRISNMMAKTYDWVIKGGTLPEWIKLD
jgi:glycosyltransferase involved in cell wall biosynthesis